MGRKRNTTTLRGGDVIDILECHDGNYGARGMPRRKKQKPTREDMMKVNKLNKARRCRMKMIQYLDAGDYYGTWTYREERRPPDMETAKKDLQKCVRKIRAFYKKSGYEFFLFRNIQEGTRGAWHIHFAVKKIPGAAEVITKAWEHGGVYLVEIKKSKFYDEDFTKLANYMTRDENTVEYKKDGTPAKPKIRQASYNTSRNMPLPKPRKEKLRTWPSEVKPKKGYYIANLYEGINPATGFRYRRYTMIRLHRRI